VKYGRCVVNPSCVVDISVNVKQDWQIRQKGVSMRIGELAALSHTPTRSLRYYEQQGLLTPRRLENGYREYDPYLIDRAMQIRGLIDSGISTKIISQILPCLDKQRAIVPEDIEPELLVVLGEDRFPHPQPRFDRCLHGNCRASALSKNRLCRRVTARPY
jgi:DNA-binding transcriptional MerR regulator